MTTFPAANYLSNAGRTEAEMKAAFEDFLAATKQLLGGGAGSTLTLAADQITPTAGFHLVDTQSAASTDDLRQVLQTNLPDGSFLLLAIATNGHTVVVKHAAGGAGQILLANAVDFSMTHTTMTLLLRRVGTSWEERDRYFGSQVAAHAAYYAAAGLGQNTFTGRQEWDKGANIAAATPLAIGTDGNYFLVTGTTTISSIASAPIGTRIVLMFQNAGCLIAHSASLILQYGNHLSRAGDLLEFISEGAGTWREIAPLGQPRVIDLVTADVTVSNTLTETAVYTKQIEGNVLGTSRRLRLTVNGRWSWGKVQTFGSTTVYGSRWRLKYGATTIADVFMPGGMWDNGISFAYEMGDLDVNVTLVCYLNADGATNAQAGYITGGALLGGNAGPGNDGSGALQGFLWGSLWGDINGVSVKGRGTASEDSTAAKNLVLTVEHNFNHTENHFVLEGATLEVLP